MKKQHALSLQKLSESNNKEQITVVGARLALEALEYAYNEYKCQYISESAMQRLVENATHLATTGQVNTVEEIDLDSIFECFTDLTVDNGYDVIIEQDYSLEDAELQAQAKAENFIIG